MLHTTAFQNNFIVEHGDILSDKKLRDMVGREKFDLITANIVADVIIDLAPDVSGWLGPQGIFMLGYYRGAPGRG